MVAGREAVLSCHVQQLGSYKVMNVVKCNVSNKTKAIVIRVLSSPLTITFLSPFLPTRENQSKLTATFLL